MARLTLEIVSELRGKGLDDAANRLEKLDKQMQQTTKSTNLLDNAARDLQSRFLALATVAAVFEFFHSVVTEASQGEQAMALLGLKVESTGQDFNKVKSQVDEFTKALSEQTKFGSTEYQTALGNMIDKTRDLGTAEKLITDAAGLAVAMHTNLASAADVVAGAFKEQPRAILQISKALGLHGAAGRDVAVVLQTLHDRYGELAFKESSFEAQQARLTNQWKDQKQIIGNELLPILTELSQLGLTIFDVFKFIWKATVDLTAGFIGLVSGAFKVAHALTTFKVFNVVGELNKLKAEIFNTTDNLDASFKEMTDSIAKAWGATGEIPKHIKEGQGAIADLLPETLELMANFTDKAAAMALSGEDKKLELVALRHRQERDALRKHLLAMGEDRKNFGQIFAAQDRLFAAENIAAKRDTFKKVEELTKKSMVTASQAIGKALFGDQNAFKDAARSIIDSVAAEAEAYVIAKSMEAAWNDAAKVGFLAGIPILAAAGGKGLADAALIAIAAEGAKAALGAGGGGGAVSAAASASPVSSASVASVGATAPAAHATPQLIVNVQGDFLGDPAVMDLFAKRLSSAVEDRGVRLVASKTH